MDLRSVDFGSIDFRLHNATLRGATLHRVDLVRIPWQMQLRPCKTAHKQYNSGEFRIGKRVPV
jgi:hypothetical protein